jgi:uncharacterized protein (DUF433 family)
MHRVQKRRDPKYGRPKVTMVRVRVLGLLYWGKKGIRKKE